MSDEGGYVRVGHRVPEHIRDAAKENTDHGELSEMVRSLYKRIAHGDTEGGVESVAIELERIRAKKDDLRDQVRKLQNELQALEQEETRLEEKLTSRRSRQDKYEGRLESLEAMLLNGSHVDADAPAVRDAADELGCTAEDVIEDLKQRNPSAPDYAFEPMDQADYRWHGVQEGPQ